MEDTNLTPGLNLRTTFYGHTDAIHRIAWMQNGEKIASPSRDKSIIIWDYKKKELEQKLLGHTDWVNSVVWSPDGKLLASGDEVGNIIIWNLKKKKQIIVLEAHKGRIECLDWSPDGKMIGSASGDGSVIIWSTKYWEKVKTIYDHRAWVNAISWSPNGKFIATGAEDNTVKLWYSNSCIFLYDIGGNQAWITDLAWSPNSKFLAYTTGNLIKIWNQINGKLEIILEGHEDRVQSVSFSCDGNFLSSKSKDNTFRMWDTTTWNTIIAIEENTTDGKMNPEAKITFHPKEPILASLGDNDTIIRIWDYSTSVLRSKLNALPSVHFTNAKVVLIGKSGAGKSCLARALIGKPFVPQESTHGLNVFLFKNENIKVRGGSELTREILLWDLAGQTDYKLIHQLFLDETSLGIILFDPSEHENPFQDVEYWNRALSKIRNRNCPKILVAARIDRGKPAVNLYEINEIKRQFGFEFYVQTSSKTGQGVEDLKKKLTELVPWDDLPVTTSPILWNKIRNLIIRYKEGYKILITKSELVNELRDYSKEVEFNLKDCETVISHAQAQGLLWQFSFGDLILLKPEYLNLYSSAIILNARNHPEGIGSVREQDILEGKIDLFDIPRLKSKSLETSLLFSVIELAIEREIGVRIGEQIVFPSKFSRKFPGELNSTKSDIIFHFEGSLETIYSTLLVRLFYSDAFELDGIWKNGAVFKDPKKNKCSIIFIDSNNGVGKIKIFFDNTTIEEIRILFIKFIQEHLEKYSNQNTLFRETILRCANCGEEVEGKRAIQKRIEMGKKTIMCLFCDSLIPILNSFENQYKSEKLMNDIMEINSEVDLKKAKAVNITKSNAKIHLNEFDVFMAHNSKDKNTILKINEKLVQRGLTPWIDVEQIPPGRWFQDILQEAIRKIKSAAIFIGKHGLGKWQILELRTFISQCVEREIPIIPILLPGVSEIPKELVFLNEFNWVRFSDNINSKEIIDSIEWGITGVNPKTKRKTVNKN